MKIIYENIFRTFGVRDNNDDKWETSLILKEFKIWIRYKKKVFFSSSLSNFYSLKETQCSVNIQHFCAKILEIFFLIFLFNFDKKIPKSFI
jgi:hypothetical protein